MDRTQVSSVAVDFPSGSAAMILQPSHRLTVCEPIHTLAVADAILPRYSPRATTKGGTWYELVATATFTACASGPPLNLIVGQAWDDRWIVVGTQNKRERGHAAPRADQVCRRGVVRV